MYIYLLWQNEVCGYDTYDSMVVIANSELRAKELSLKDVEPSLSVWADNINDIKCEKLGMANIINSNKERVVLKSFNAG